MPSQNTEIPAPINGLRRIGLKKPDSCGFPLSWLAPNRRKTGKRSGMSQRKHVAREQAEGLDGGVPGLEIEAENPG